jgi:hypothetical protein
MTQPRPWEVAGTREVPAHERELLKDAGDIMIRLPYPWEPQSPEPTWKDLTSSDDS